MNQSIIQEVIETPNAFVGLLSTPAITNQIQLEITEVSSSRRTKRQESTIPVEIDVIPGKLLIVIPKDKLTMLVRGSNYSIMVRKAFDL